MTSGIARRSDGAGGLRLGLAAAFLASGCVSFVEVPVEVPLQSKIDVGAFRRVLVAGFIQEPGDRDVDVAAETARLLQNQLRSSRLQVLEPDRPPLYDALDEVLENLGEGDSYSREDRERFGLEADQVLQDAEFWRRVGEEFQSPLIITGRVHFDEQNRSGYQPEERVVRDPKTLQPRLIRRNRYLERKAFSLTADFVFVDGRSGEVLHRENFTEEVLYGADQKVSPLSSYFELMDRLLPNFLGVISPQRIRGTRILLQ